MGTGPFFCRSLSGTLVFNFRLRLFFYSVFIATISVSTVPAIVNAAAVVEEKVEDASDHIETSQDNLSTAKKLITAPVSIKAAIVGELAKETSMESLLKLLEAERAARIAEDERVATEEKLASVIAVGILKRAAAKKLALESAAIEAKAALLSQQ